MYTQLISIHAPRTGSDALLQYAAMSSAISIHAPRTGSDCDFAIIVNLCIISIHAPRTGSDPFADETDAPPAIFQSTLPARGATQPERHNNQNGGYFNPRSPHGERLAIFRAVAALLISIHAPRTGSDRQEALYEVIISDFNPRSPHGERQRKVTILSIRIIGFAQKVYHKTVLLRISLAENAVILPEKPRNPVRTSLQKAGGLRFARAIRAARPYSISSPSGA